MADLKARLRGTDLLLWVPGSAANLVLRLPPSVAVAIDSLMSAPEGTISLLDDKMPIEEDWTNRCWPAVEIERRTGIGHRRVVELVKRGLARAYQLHGTYYINLDDVIHAIRMRRVRTPLDRRGLSGVQRENDEDDTR